MAALRYGHLFLLTLCFLCMPGAFGSNHTSGYDNDNNNRNAWGSWLKAVGFSAGYLALYIVVPIIFCGGFSLLAYLFFKCCYKPKTSPLGPAGIHPEWTRHVEVDGELAGHGFWTASSGLCILNQNTVVRHHQHSFQTDGARWSHGFTSGRHVFKITWDRAQRGSFASVGVATVDAPLSVAGKKTLVGDTKDSWGFDISRRRAVHRGQMVGSMRAADGFVPDTFFMYLNVEDGKIGFGTEERFYGYLLTGVPHDQPLYPMIGTMMSDANITMQYQGTSTELPGPAWATGGAVTVGPPGLYSMEKGLLPGSGFPGHAVPKGDVVLPDYQSVMEEGNSAQPQENPQSPPSPPPPYSSPHQKY